MSGSATSAAYESRTFAMPCFDAKASARLRSRAATAPISASCDVRAGLTTAPGAMRAAPRIPIRTVPIRRTVQVSESWLLAPTGARRDPGSDEGEGKSMGTRLRSAARFRVGIMCALVLLVAGCDWTATGFGPGNTNFNPSEPALTESSVHTLGVAWSVPCACSRALVANGRVYAIDGLTGSQPSTLTARAFD